MAPVELSEAYSFRMSPVMVATARGFLALSGLDCEARRLPLIAPMPLPQNITESDTGRLRQKKWGKPYAGHYATGEGNEV
jgi:hypothetical protein